MAQPQSAEAVFESINEQTKSVRTLQEMDAFVDAQIAKAQQSYPDLQDLNIRGYYSYHVHKYSQKLEQEKARPLFTAEQLFETAYNWAPMGPDGGKDLHQLLGSDRFENITLGKLRGQTRLDLIPGIGILPSSNIPDGCTKFDLAYTNGGAISYADGHPSEAGELVTISAPKDGKLRRFMPLGWVIQVDSSNDKKWTKTGHVLVMDMDEGRNRHPWFVLASEWPNDRDIPLNDDMTVYAEKHVAWNDRDAYGVFPEDKNRTPIARLRTKPGQPTAGPMLLQFGPNFEFDVTRLGGAEKGAPRTGRGPDLAHIMHWYEDEERNKEVCYSPNGKEYMRYNRQTKQYRYPIPDFKAWRQQVGMSGASGVSEGPPVGPVSLASRIGQMSFDEAQRHHRRSEASTSHS